MKKVIPAALIALGIALILYGHPIQHWLAIHTGTVIPPGSPYYNFWSAFGSDISELTLFVGVVTYLRSKTCHVHHCWRFGKHSVGDGRYMVCRKHHPAMDNAPTTAEHVQAHHDAFIQSSQKDS